METIRQTAKENGGKPLGRIRFENESGITPYQWSKYWARFTEAQKEAGFSPNQLNQSLDEEFVIKKMIDLIRKLKKFPTLGELRVEKNSDPEFPHSQSFFETKIKKIELAHKIFKWSEDKDDYQDIIEYCFSIFKDNNQNNNNLKIDLGEVYLLKSGRYYKIGKTNDIVRRGAELRIQLPEKLNLIHSIKTDDPSGIEAYWHKRFSSKRMQGEWFDLSVTDIRAFKLWKRIA